MKVRENNFMTTDSIMVENYGDAILYVRKAYLIQCNGQIYWIIIQPFELFAWILRR